jgi:hypothetical protein
MTHVYQRDGVRMVSFNKSGHKSIVLTFLALPGGADSQELAARTLRGGFGSKHKQAWHDWPAPIVTVAFVRHPLARIASVWNHLFRDRVGYTPLRKHGFTEDMVFEQYVHQLLKVEYSSDMDFHLAPQAFCLDRCATNTISQHVYRLDDIAEGWPRMCQTYGLECETKVAHHNDRSQNYPQGRPWTALWEGLEDEAGELVHGLYERDYDMWGTGK